MRLGLDHRRGPAAVLGHRRGARRPRGGRRRPGPGGRAGAGGRAPARRRASGHCRGADAVRRGRRPTRPGSPRCSPSRASTCASWCPSVPTWRRSSSSSPTERPRRSRSGHEAARGRARAAAVTPGGRSSSLLVTAAFVLAWWSCRDAAYDTRPVSAHGAGDGGAAAGATAGRQPGGVRAVPGGPRAPTSGRTRSDGRLREPAADARLVPHRAPQLDLAREVDDGGTAVLVILLAGLAMLVGATFAGADWASGSMSTQLLLRAAAAACVDHQGARGVVGCTGRRGRCCWPCSGASLGGRRVPVVGSTSPDEAWTSILADLGPRRSRWSPAVALGGFALTMLFRSTVATLGLLFAYAVVGEGLAASLPIDKMSQWSMANNVMAWLHDGTRSTTSRSVPARSTRATPLHAHARPTRGLPRRAAAARGRGSASVFFRRRDVP